MKCPQCGESIGTGDAFCENCGATLAGHTVSDGLAPQASDESARTHLFTPLRLDPDELPALACAECGGEVSDDGWCTICGARASNGREHVAEQPTPTVAAVSDKGRVHPRNEDAVALAVGDEMSTLGPGAWAALVVCDGVTTSTDGDAAAFAAARAARDLLAAADRPTGSPGARQQFWSRQLKAAASVADKAAGATASPQHHNPPSCTFVGAIADGAVIVAGWVGDSRAYWLPDPGRYEPDSNPAQLLSVDDSWATEQIAAGVARDVAEADPKAHAITKWLGADSPAVDATTSATIATTSGWLLVCSDGLWNYCSGAEDLRRLTAEQPSEALACAEALVKWANEQGGHDNITVALARIAPEE
jgi:serine/threonine protein phosphatase PrpC